MVRVGGRQIEGHVVAPRMRNRVVAMVAAFVVLFGAFGASCSFGDDGPTTADNPEQTPEVQSKTVTADTNDSNVPTPTAIVVDIEGTQPGNIYIVQPGDLLGTIAQRLEVDPDELAELNGITDPNLLSVGQELKIPGAEEDTEADG